VTGLALFEDHVKTCNALGIRIAELDLENRELERRLRESMRELAILGATCKVLRGERDRYKERADGGSWFNVAHNTTSGKGQTPDGRKTIGHINRRDGHTHTRHLTNQAESDGLKVSRKAAAAMIAKIPFRLARHIAHVYKPEGKGGEVTPWSSHGTRFEN
jgi:hypothetical protein